MSLLDVLLIVFLAAALLAGLLFWLRGRRASAEAREAGRARAEALAARGEVERRYEQSLGYMAALGDASPDALLLLDANRQILWGNSVAWELFGSSGPAVGQTFIGLTHDYELNQAVLDAISGGRPIVRQAAVNGRTLRIRTLPMEQIGGAAVAIDDVTELQRLGRARRDFVANLSHELRTPLANIDLAAQTLRDSGAKNPALSQRMLGQIQTQVQVLSQLSQEMMDLAQIESGKVLLTLVAAPIEPLMRRTVANLYPQATNKGQHISMVVPTDLEALMDEQQVARVIGNLVHNAIKFTPAGGIISISAEAVDDDVRCCISDTGPGVPKEEQSRIFERFYKQDRARSMGGTGLGLAIARHIVEGHGGRIWVQSAPGQGATFCFTLPKA